MITTIKAYKAADGKLYDTASQAQAAEFRVQIQAFFNNRTSAASFTPPIIAGIVERDIAVFLNLLQVHKAAMKRLLKKECKVCN
jgi:hypothetical protein